MTRLRCLLAGLLLPWGCSQTIVLNSEPPGLEVYAGDKLIGKTPLTTEPELLESALNPAGHLVLSLKKPGFQAIRLVIPKTHRTLRLDLNLRNLLAAQLQTEPAAGEPHAGRLRVYFKDTAAILTEQSKVLSGGNLDQALLDKIAQAYPDSGAPFLLQGLKLAAAGDSEKAKVAVTEALSRNPWSIDLHEILSDLERIAKPAQEEPPRDATPQEPKPGTPSSGP